MALNNHFLDIERRLEMKDNAFWSYKSLSDTLDSDYYSMTGFLKQYKHKTEQRLMENSVNFERRLTEFKKKSNKKLGDEITKYTYKVMMNNLYYISILNKMIR